MEDMAKQHITNYVRILVDNFNILCNSNIETEIYTDDESEGQEDSIVGVYITVPEATIGIHATFPIEKFFNIALAEELSGEFWNILNMYIKEKDHMKCSCCENTNLTEEEKEFEYTMRKLMGISSVDKDNG